MYVIQGKQLGSVSIYHDVTYNNILYQAWVIKK